MKTLLKTSFILLIGSFILHFSSFSFASPPTIDSFLGSLKNETVQTDKIKADKSLKENIQGLLYPSTVNSGIL
ncbi:MAG: hypothetical protein LBD11_08955 [Candidatus Peribacteria bacterium]|jgi:hypothetical protein|nr:hypothetical protein [Candidatus Peribacteria bacterium]